MKRRAIPTRHPDMPLDISLGVCHELIEITCFRVVVDGIEYWKTAVHAARKSPRSGKLEPLAADWATGKTLDDCFAKLNPEPEPETMDLFQDSPVR